MKSLLYVTVVVLLSSVECTVIRQTANSIDKPSSNRVVHCPGCGSSIVKPDPVNGLETSASDVPASPSDNEVVDQDTEQNQEGGQGSQDGQGSQGEHQLPEVSPQEHKGDIGLPIGEELVNKLINKAGDLKGAFAPKFTKRDIGLLFPIGGEYVSEVMNKWEDFVESLIPKVGKRDLRSRRRSNGRRIGERFGSILLTPFV